MRYQGRPKASSTDDLSPLFTPWLPVVLCCVRPHRTYALSAEGERPHYQRCGLFAPWKSCDIITLLIDHILLEPSCYVPILAEN